MIVKVGGGLEPLGPIGVYVYDKIYGNNFIKQHSETVMDRNYQNRDCCLGKKKILCQKCYLLGAYNFRHTFVPYIGTTVNSISLSKRKKMENEI